MKASLQNIHNEFLESGVQSELHVPLAPLTTYAVGGVAECVVRARSLEDVRSIARIGSQHSHVPVFVLGRGSNVLVADSGFDGIAILVSTPVADTHISVTGNLVEAPASMTMPVLARRSVAANRAGLEWCVGIPGTVGGAVRMNAGGHGAEIVDSLVSATIVSLKSGVESIVPVADLGLHFRGSALSGHHVVVSATFTTTEGTSEEGTQLINEIVSWRRDHQPGGRNAGSVFVNPSPGKGSAGALIDAAGLRGYACGGASVSEKHANFIQATDSATAGDIVAVMKHVQEEVERVHGVRLRSEVHLLGFDSQTADQFADPRHSEPERMSALHHVAHLLGEI